MFEFRSKKGKDAEKQLQEIAAGLKQMSNVLDVVKNRARSTELFLESLVIHSKYCSMHQGDFLRYGFFYYYCKIQEIGVLEPGGESSNLKRLAEIKLLLNQLSEIAIDFSGLLGKYSNLLRGEEAKSVAGFYFYVRQFVDLRLDEMQSFHGLDKGIMLRPEEAGRPY